VKPLPHDRAFEVLPWLVNGTLANAEREAVEEHARTCIACRRELKQQRQLYAAALTRRTADVSVDAGFEQLDRELDATARGGRLRWPIRYTAAAPFAVAAAAGVAVLAVLLWFTPLPELTNRTYSTLATPASENAAMLDIVFAADATTTSSIRCCRRIISSCGRFSSLWFGGMTSLTPPFPSSRNTKSKKPSGKRRPSRFAGRSMPS
jgi:hypothetical protein